MVLIIIIKTIKIIIVIRNYNKGKLDYVALATMMMMRRRRRRRIILVKMKMMRRKK